MQTTQIEQADLFEGRERRERGLRQALQPDARKNLIADARKVAAMLAERNGDVTSDEVVAFYQDQGVNLPAILGNGMGSLFRSNRFVPTGEYRQSQRPSRHAAVVRVWKVAA